MNIEFRFHGGCYKCTQPLETCDGCCFCETNWKLPNLNNNAYNAFERLKMTASTDPNELFKRRKS